MSDIKSMFYQVCVCKEDTDCLRFFWWPKCDMSRKPLVYRMKVHIFGATSSPACSNIALHQSAKDNRDLISSETCDSVFKNFYVDDFLKSVSSEKEAIILVKELTKLCSQGGFHLTKWTSNRRTVIESLPIEERAKDLKHLDLATTDIPNERALGVKWCVENDHFGFNVVRHDSVPTRRNMLSIVSSLFDPIGFVSPFSLRAKMILQDVCRKSIPWDQELLGDDLAKWLRWLEDLKRLDQFTIQRCLKPSHFGVVTRCQIHHFADASENGYGVTTYIRLVNGDGRIHVILLMSKARVTPLKKITIPRLELTAATLAVRLNRIVVTELEYEVDDVYYWTDSMAVLRYIRNVSTRFQTFVANRLALIREASEVKQWMFVKSEDNPADDVSRGMQLNDMLTSDRWINGPEFLSNRQNDWPVQPETESISDNDIEIKKKANLAIEHADDDVMIRLMSYFSSWIKLKKTVAWLMVAKRNLKSRLLRISTSQVNAVQGTSYDRKKKPTFSPLTVAMLDEAELMICQFEQKRYFQEINFFTSGSGRSCILKKSSALYRLDPIIVDGTLRVGGRLSRSTLSYDAKHPIIMPAESPVSKLILESVHQSVGHLGRNSILAEVRQKFWIVRANYLIRRLLSRCVICRRYRAKCLVQKMADLPVSRTLAGDPPFTRVGMDFFGPIEVKQGRSTIKRYGVVFTCLSIRAVHLELASTLNTDSCINAIRRFTARRGPVKMILSDNGTNLVGAKKELQDELSRWNQCQIHDYFLQKGIEWELNPPSGSHFGGIWERIIRLVRKVLYSLLRHQTVRLDDEALRTLFCEVEAVLNARPITKISSDYNDLEALTPNHLLLLRSGSELPCGIFNSDSNYARRRWRQIQFLADSFWTRWSREYLTLLQERQKWIQPKTNVAVNDIVLIADSAPRNSWALGRVLEVIQDKKGFVRIVCVKTKTSVLCRPIHKLCLLLEGESS